MKVSAEHSIARRLAARSASIAAITIVLVLSAGFASAATLIDTWNPAGVTQAAGGGAAPLAQIVVGANNVRVDRFANRIDPQAAGTLTWAIFTDAGAFVYLATQPSLTTGMGWYDSPSTSVVLEAGKTYYFGTIPTESYWYSYDTVATYGDGLSAPSVNGGATIIDGSVVFGAFSGTGAIAIRIEGEVLTSVETAATLAQQAGGILATTSTSDWAGPNGSGSNAKKAAATSQLDSVIDLLAIASDPNEPTASRCTAYGDAISLLIHLIAKCDGSRGSWTDNPDLAESLQNTVTTAIGERAGLGCQ